MFAAEINVEAKYIRIANIVRKNIEDGYLKSGQQIPNENILSEQFKVSRNTVRDAIGLLINENLLVREKGRGTFVSNTLENRNRKTFGLVLYGVKNPFYSVFSNDVFKGAKAEIMKQNSCRLELIIIENEMPPRDFISEAKERKLAGVFIMGGTFDKFFMTEIAKSIPVVLIGKTLPESNIPAVTPDPEKTIRVALQHLFELGHRKIAYMPSIIHHIGYQEKLDFYCSIYKEMCSEYGVDYEPMYELGEYEDVAVEIMEKYSPTAIMTSSDSGITAMNVLQERGFCVPEDISFMALDDLGKAALASPPMTVVNINNQEIGHRAVRCLQRLARKEKIPARIKVNCRLIERKSTRRI